MTDPFFVVCIQQLDKNLSFLMFSRAVFTSFRCFRQSLFRTAFIKIIKRRFIFVFAVVGHILISLQTNPHIAAENQCGVDEYAKNIQKHLDSRNFRSFHGNLRKGEQIREAMLRKEKQHGINRKTNRFFTQFFDTRLCGDQIKRIQKAKNQSM